MQISLDGKVALVTGASKGIGRAIAGSLADAGAKVMLSSRKQDQLEAAAAEIGGDTAVFAANAGDIDAAKACVAATVERFGGLDILVANAGGPPAARALDVEDAQVLAAINANQLTSIRLVQAAVPHMKAAGWGRICLITSFGVKQPIPTLAYSNIARTGLWAWAKTAAQDLIADGITLNLALPGLHATDRAKEIGAAGRMGDPDDFGKVVAFLCSQPAGFVSGAALQVDGASILGLL